MTPHTNDADEARYFAQIGVDVIASDDPRIVTPLRFMLDPVRTAALGGKGGDDDDVG
jgi:hypothetical protein